MFFTFMFFLGREGHLNKTRIPRDECISFDHELSVMLYETDRGYTCECSSTVNIVLQHLQKRDVLEFCVGINDDEDVQTFIILLDMRKSLWDLNVQQFSR